MSVESTRATMTRYFNAEHGDTSTLAQDVVFVRMASGEETRGPQAVMAMIHHQYHVAFEADMDVRVSLFGDQQAMIEGDFVGRHIGEFTGVPPTGKEVRVPLCVVYFLQDDRIQRAHVYFETAALLRQLAG